MDITTNYPQNKNNCKLKSSNAYNTTKIITGKTKIKALQVKNKKYKPIHIVSYMNNKRRLKSDIILSDNHL